MSATTRSASTGSSATTAASDFDDGLAALRLRPDADEPLSVLVRLFLARESACRCDVAARARARSTCASSPTTGPDRRPRRRRAGAVRAPAVRGARRRVGPCREPAAGRPRRPDRARDANARRADRAPAGRAAALDLGTGSGVQAFLAARHSGHVVGLDLNPRALRLARLNAALNGVENVDWRQGDLFEPVRDERLRARRRESAVRHLAGARAHLPRRWARRRRALARGRRGRGTAPPRGRVREHPLQLGHEPGPTGRRAGSRAPAATSGCSSSRPTARSPTPCAGTACPAGGRRPSQRRPSPGWPTIAPAGSSRSRPARSCSGSGAGRTGRASTSSSLAPRGAAGRPPRADLRGPGLPARRSRDEQELLTAALALAPDTLLVERRLRRRRARASPADRRRGDPVARARSGLRGSGPRRARRAPAARRARRTPAAPGRVATRRCASSSPAACSSGALTCGTDTAQHSTVTDERETSWSTTRRRRTRSEDGRARRDGRPRRHAAAGRGRQGRRSRAAEADGNVAAELATTPA